MINSVKNFMLSTVPKYLPKVTLVLLAIDVFLVLLHVVVRLTPPPDYKMLLLTTDRGIPEIYQYLKGAFLAGTLIFVALKYRRGLWLYLNWALLYLYILIDDATELHEKVGDAFLNNQIMGTSSEAVNELAAILAISLILVSFIAIAYYFTSDSTAKDVSKLYIFGSAIFVFFAVFFDAIHSQIIVMAPSLSDNDKIQEAIIVLFALIEESGEQMAMSILVGLTIGILCLTSERVGHWSSVN